MFGLFNINKPVGPTSHGVVARVRQTLGRNVKVGHAGTLDPFASGVLVICTGAATRLASYVQNQPKRYIAEVTLGATSTTDDSEGVISEPTNRTPPDQQRIEELLDSFIGEISQIPPAHSAVHVNGTRAYKIARKGAAPEIPARNVTVHSIDLLKYVYPLLTIDICCGSGTYIRSIARDLGAALGSGGYCSALTRSEVGRFTLDDAIGPEEIDPGRHLISPLMALGDMPQIPVDDAEAKMISMGQRPVIDVGRLGSIDLSAETEREVAIIYPAGILLSIARLTPDGEIKPRRVFTTG